MTLPGEENPSHQLRREPRHGCPLTTMAQAGDAGDEERPEQTVWLANISCNGLAFYSGRSFLAGERLILRIKYLELHRQGVVLEVMHTTRQPNGDWLVGCKLDSPLSDEEVRQCQRDPE